MTAMNVATASTCRRCQSPIEPGDLRCAICALVTERRRSDVARPIARVLRCQGCGAALTYSAEATAPRCAFCAAVMQIEQPSDPLEVAERVLPFAVRPEQAHAAVKAWLSTLGFFRPSDLATAASIEGIRPILWCGWVAHADTLVSWTADSNAGSGRSDWAPHAGQARMHFGGLLVPASRGLRLQECHALTPHYDLSGLVDAPSASEGPAGAIVEQFDVQRSAARAIVIDAIGRTAAARVEREGHCPGSRFRKVHVSVLLHAMRTERVALPAYVLAYRYKGASYRTIVHGQDARITFGDAPYSIAKIALVILLVAIAVVSIVLVLIGVVAGAR